MKYLWSTIEVAKRVNEVTQIYSDIKKLSSGMEWGFDAYIFWNNFTKALNPEIVRVNLWITKTNFSPLSIFNDCYNYVIVIISKKISVILSASLFLF